MGLDGAVTILTGATGGIGRAVAHRLAARGGRLVLVARRPGPLAELADALTSHEPAAAATAAEVAPVATGTVAAAVPVAGDVADEGTARAAVEAALDRFGGVDVLVNAAGYGPPQPLVGLTRPDWDATIASCLTGPYAMTRAVLPAMLAAGRGRVVHVSSIAGKAAEANRTAYCAAKWGLEGFTHALRHELAGTGVGVHVLNPAAVATGWWDTTGDPQPASVLARMMAPDDVADAVVWLLDRPDHLHVPDLTLLNATNPWAP